MKWLWSKRWARLTAGISAGLLLVALASCWTCRIWSVKDFLLYRYFVSQYPFGNDLWFGRIGPGQSVDQLVKLIPPHGTDQYGRYTSLSYYPGGPPGPGALPFEGLEIVAKDGRLVRAWGVGCTWDRKFFDMNAADTEEYDRVRNQVSDERHRRYREGLNE